MLRDTLKNELSGDLKAVEDYVLNGVITFRTAWMIFEPGQIVYGKKDGQPVAAKLTNTSLCEDEYGNKWFRLKCEVFEWGGLTFGTNTDRFMIPNFAGTSLITKLAFFPLIHHQKADMIREQLVERGKKSESLAGYQYKFYEGIAIGNSPWDRPIKYNVSHNFGIIPSRTH